MSTNARARVRGYARHLATTAWRTRRATAILLIAVAVLASVAFQAGRDRGLAGVATVALAALGASGVLLFGLAVAASGWLRRATLLPLISVIALFGIAINFGSPRWGWDLLWVLVALAASVAVTRRRRTHPTPSRATHVPRPMDAAVTAGTWTFWLVLWALISGGDALLDRGAIRKPILATVATSNQSSWPTARVGVALSGGGYRAALYHASVMQVLDSLRVPMTAVSTVSGGSLLGSFYATGGRPEDFLAAMQARRFNSKRELLHVQTIVPLIVSSRILGTRYSLWPGANYDRTDVQADMLDRVYLGSWRHRETVPATPDTMGRRRYADPPLTARAADLYDGHPARAHGRLHAARGRRSPCRGGTEPFRGLRPDQPEA